MTEPGAPGANGSAGQSYPVILKASISHQILTLIGSGFLFFEFVFLNMYFDRSWFALDLRMFGIPAILLSVLLAHGLLTLGESRLACRWFSPILRGRPLVVYRKWLELNNDAIVFGLRQVRYEAIDMMELTLLGNLVVSSKAVGGESALFPDKVLKLPFSAADFPTQDRLIEAVKEHRADVVLNKRIATGRKATLQKGAQVTQLVTAAIMVLLLFDVGFSSFYYLDLLKNYFMAESDYKDGDTAAGAAHFVRGEDLRLHPLPFSWVSAKFLKSSSVASGIWEQRARVLWLQGKHAEAIEDGMKAIAETPSNLRHRLFQTRMFVDENKIPEAREQLEKILADHKHSFMPRLYTLAILKEREGTDKLSKDYKEQLDPCFEDTYEQEPHWPPGGNRFFTELFYSEDARFLLDRFLGSKYSPPPIEPDSGKKKPESK